MSEAIFDTILIYQFLRRLVVPFDESEAFRYGLIDAEGRRLRSPETQEELNADRPFDRLVMNLKRLIERVPGGRGILGSVVAALVLLREGDKANYWNAHPSQLHQLFTEELKDTTYLQQYLCLFEDAPANAAGGGHIAGIGVGQDGEPGVKKKKEEYFGSVRLFDVAPEHYYKSRLQKKKFSNYKHWVGEDEAGQDVREYANANPGKPVILRNQLTGAMMFLRHGKQQQRFHEAADPTTKPLGKSPADKKVQDLQGKGLSPWFVVKNIGATDWRMLQSNEDVKARHADWDVKGPFALNAQAKTALDAANRSEDEKAQKKASKASAKVEATERDTEYLDKPTPTIAEIAKKHNVSEDYIRKQLAIGMKIESEHTTNVGLTREIALDHLNEKPDYYVKLKKVEEGRRKY